MMALEGIRIVEIGTHGPAAFAGGMLGDLGAEVVRVEVPADSPLAARSAFARKNNDHAHQTADRNKRSITVNPGAPGGREVIEALAKWADVVIDEFLPGTLEQAGLGYERFRSINPRAVHCAITAYGQNGPYRNLPGDDLTAQALGGHLLMAGNSLGNIGNPVEAPPALPNVLVAESKAMTHAVIAILAALWARRTSGQGQFIDIGALDGVVSQQAVRPMGGRDRVRVSSGLHETKDGKYVALAAGEAWAWANLARTLGGDQYADIAELNADEAKAQEAYAFLQKIFKTKTQDEWLRIFAEVDTEVTPVHTPEEVPNDPQMQLRDQQVVVTTVDGRRSVQYGVPMHLPDTPGTVRSPAPRPGQDTEAVLRDLSYDESGVQRLREAKAIG